MRMVTGLVNQQYSQKEMQEHLREAGFAKLREMGYEALKRGSSKRRARDIQTRRETEENERITNQKKI